LPDELASGVYIFFFKLTRKEDASVVFADVLRVKAAHVLYLLANLRQGATRQWDGAIFLAFARSDGL